MRTVEWDYERDRVLLIDQRLLPGEVKVRSYDSYQDVALAITDMVVRGAPAIGATAAFGFALAALRSSAQTVQALREELKQAADALMSSRPTAVNLKWALNRMLRIAEECNGDVDVDLLREAILAEAQQIADEDVEINQCMARYGVKFIEDGDTLIHHCNTGALAAVDWGTALGVIRMAHKMGKRFHVLVDETRPRLQGARLTAWELSQYGISYDVISDNSAGYFLQTGIVQKVFFGADRVAANGDVANKIGTYMLSIAAVDNLVPVYCVVPTSTIDLKLTGGDQIPIEERPQEEVLELKFYDRKTTPPGATARNPAFDITPHRLITAFITENGVVYPPFERNLANAVKDLRE